MSATYLSLCMCLLLAAVFAAPSENSFPEEPSEGGVRLPRATCELLSFSGKDNSVVHAACAAHCLVLNKGFRGGSCKDGVCHCRK